MKQYKLINNVLGWVAFAIAAFVYCSTIEPTASFWDCSEFITTAYKFEVGHPPGAPFFMVMANMFTQFVDDPSKVAMMVNVMSAIMSAACILFLFWTITHLVRKLICHKGIVETTAQTIAIMGSGMVGALAYTFSDTFWFSAVEGEVYASSSFFTAVVFWLILKWEENADNPHSDRYLVLIAYLVGLSIGVHLLNLLCITPMVLVYYYRKAGDKSDLKGSLWALVVSFVLIAVVLYGIVPGIVKMAGWSELLFVNVLGTPFNTGEVVYIIALFAVVVWGVAESYRAKSVNRMNIAFLLSVAMLGIPFFGVGWKGVVTGFAILAVLVAVLFKSSFVRKYQEEMPRVLNTTLLCFLMIMVGYSSYAISVIRSAANPPMDQNSPEDVFSLGEYLNRDQYGSKPLLYGPAYTSPIKYRKEGKYYVGDRTEGAPIIQRVEKRDSSEPDRYEQIGTKGEYRYAANMIFPRIWDSQHASSYEAWLGGVEGRQISVDRGTGQEVTIKMPSQIDNLRFFFSYQLNHMYWRYFMWNFSGRQNDIQGNGEHEHGNWISGFSFLDNLRLGDQSKLPDELKENKACNKFYMLPLILGLIGLFWQAYRGRKGIRQFWVVFFLFFMTGIAIIIYLNQTPLEPRERDYAYAGSFYAFTVWIGMGVAAIIEWLERVKRANATLKAALVSAVCLCVPIQMATQTWDDHDRSNRYVCRDFGQNYLASLSETGNPVIFTNGDNETFPLWYNLDVEETRQDTRVCNLSYLQTDWYIDQMRRPAYTSPALPIDWKRYEYVTGVNDGVMIRPEMKAQVRELYNSKDSLKIRRLLGDDPFELKNVLKNWVRSEDESMHCIPTDTLYLTVDKEAVKRSGMLLPESGEIPDKLAIALNGRDALYKNSLMMLEMLANANWERPLYFSVTVAPSLFLSLSNNFIQEGLAYRISPFETHREGNFVDVDRMYDNMLHKFKYGNISAKGIYLDENVLRMCYTHRRMLALLADELMTKGDKTRALEVVEFADKMIPHENVPYGDNLGGTLNLARVFARCGNTKKAAELLNAVAQRSEQYLEWYLNHALSPVTSNARDCREMVVDLFRAVDMMKEVGLTDAALHDGAAMAYYRELLNRGLDFGN